MCEAIELRLVIDGPVLKGVRRWAQLENFDGHRPDDYEPTTEELSLAAREMLAECAGRLGCEVCGAPGPGDHPRACLSGNPFGMSEGRDSLFDMSSIATTGIWEAISARGPRMRLDGRASPAPSWITVRIVAEDSITRNVRGHQLSIAWGGLGEER